MKVHFFIDETGYNANQFRLLNEIGRHYTSHPQTGRPDEVVVHLPRSEWFRKEGFVDAESTALSAFHKEYPHLTVIVAPTNTTSKTYIDAYKKEVAAFDETKFNALQEGVRTGILQKFRKLAYARGLPLPAERTQMQFAHLALDSQDFSSPHDQCTLAAFSINGREPIKQHVPDYSDTVDRDIRENVDELLPTIDRNDRLIVLSEDQGNLTQLHKLIDKHGASARAVALPDRVFTFACGLPLTRSDQIDADTKKICTKILSELRFPRLDEKKSIARTVMIERSGNKALELLDLSLERMQTLRR